MLLGALVAEVLGMGDAAGIAVVVVATVLGVWMGGEWIAGRMRTGRERMARETESLAEDLAQQLGSTRARRSEGTRAKSEGRLDASFLDDSLPDSEATVARKRARS